MEESAVQAFIDRQDWKTASTYAKTAPHQYIVWAKLKESEAALVGEISAFIEANGKPERFYSKIFRYYHYGPYKYWIMNGDDGLPEIMNRARI